MMKNVSISGLQSLKRYSPQRLARTWFLRLLELAGWPAVLPSSAPIRTVDLPPADPDGSSGSVSEDIAAAATRRCAISYLRHLPDQRSDSEVTGAA